jgi:thiamine biosynthesis protein ThiS
MPIKINGKEVAFTPGVNLQELLVEKGFLPEKVIVEHNLRIVPKEEWHKVVIAQNDILEVLSFVGGG